MGTKNVNKAKQISISKLREVFWIDGNRLKWKTIPPGSRRNPIQAGYLDLNGYYQVNLNYKMYYAHRVVFAIVHGRWPNGIIDHIDGNTTNNHPANLRDVTDSENNQNQKIRKDNVLGITGVSEHAKGGYQAEVCKQGVRHRKWFKTLQAAIQWRAKMKQSVHIRSK